MVIPRHIRKQLPKARLFHIEIGGYYYKPYFAWFYCANFVRWQLWKVCITHRWFWREDIAKRQYPRLFRDNEVK